MAYLFKSHWPLVRPLQLIDDSGTMSEILLAPDQEHRNAETEMRNL